MEKRDPIIHQVREVYEKSGIDVKAARAEYYPVVQASADYTASKGSAFLPNVETHQWTIGANVSIPIYSGGETAAKTQRAAATEREQFYLLEETVRNRSENLKQSFFNLKYNADLLKALEQKVKSAETQLNAVRKGRTIGTRSAIDVLNAEQAYSVAQRDYKSALYDNILRQIQLKSSAGILEEDAILPPKAAKQAAISPITAETVKEAPPPAPLTRNTSGQVGLGVLIVARDPRQSGSEMTLPVSNQPGSIVESQIAVESLVRLNDFPGGTSGAYHVSVFEKREEWVKCILGESGRAVWAQLRSPLKVIGWKEYFVNRRIRMLPGLPKDYYTLSDSRNEKIGVVTPQDTLTVLSVFENWAYVATGSSQKGWLRWSSTEKQLLVSIVE